MFCLWFSSMILVVIGFRYLDTLDRSHSRLFEILAFCPETFFFAENPTYLKIVIAVSNICCAFYLAAFLKWHRPDPPEDRYLWQDRNQAALALALFFYCARVFVIFLKLREEGLSPAFGAVPPGSNVLVLVLFPAFNISSLSCMLLYLARKSEREP